MKRGKALVLGSGSRTFLSVVRSLSRGGVEVHAAWCSPGASELSSRHLTRVHDLPAYSVLSPAWLERLLALVDSERFALVLPIGDEHILPLQRYRHLLPEAIGRALLDERAFRIVSSKLETIELARSLDIPVPQQVVVDRQTPDLPSGWEYPVMVKPIQSFALETLPVRHLVERAQNPSHLRELVGRLGHGPTVILQKVFPGEGLGLEVLARQGEILMAFQHRRIRERHGWGTTYRESLAVDPPLLQAGRKLLAALRYTGVGMLEFRRHPDSGDWVLLEINGRFWGSLPLAVAAGADFPCYLYDLLVEGRRSFPERYRTGLFARNLLADFYWLEHHWDWRAAPAAAPTLAREVGRLLAGRERWDTLAWDDPAPFWNEWMRVLARSRA